MTPDQLRGKSVTLRPSTQFSSPEAYSVHLNDRHAGYIAMTYTGGYEVYDQTFNHVGYSHDRDQAVQQLGTA